VASATNYKRRFAETQRADFQAAVLTHLSVDIRSTISRKTWMGDRKKCVVCKLDGLAACIWGIDTAH